MKFIISIVTESPPPKVAWKKSEGLAMDYWDISQYDTQRITVDFEFPEDFDRSICLMEQPPRVIKKRDYYKTMFEGFIQTLYPTSLVEVNEFSKKPTG